MQVADKPIITNFKGSFKKVDLNDYLPDEDNYSFDRNIAKINPIEKHKTSPKQPVTRYFESCRDNLLTSTIFWDASKENISKQIPQSLKNLFKFHGISLENDLFMITGINAKNQHFVIFNSYYKDENTNQNCEQIFCLKSENHELTPLQIDVINIFNDIRNKRLFMDGSTKNPFKNIADNNCNSVLLFETSTHALASISKKRPINEITNEKGHIYPVIYSADSEYIRYRVVPITV